MPASVQDALSAPSTHHASEETLRQMDAYWRASNYIAASQIYLKDNPLLRRPLQFSDIKPRLLGHWGTTPGLNFVYTHLNRIITEREQRMLFVTGPGHGAPAVLAQTWLEGSFPERYPDMARNEAGLHRLQRQFSWPYGLPSHAAPETPGSIHEGGELGYSLLHACGAAFDNPNLVVPCVVGDGEAESGPAAASWHFNKFLNPARDGAVLPILHLNGYKIANPTILARIPDSELRALFEGYGFEPILVSGSDPKEMHRLMADMLDRVFDCLSAIRREARAQQSRGETVTRPRWPMLILRTPKGWTGPHAFGGVPIEGTWRAHQVPLAVQAPSAGDQTDPAEREDDERRLRALEAWLRSYKPETLFDGEGRPVAALRDLPPRGDLRMGSTPHANGGELRTPLVLPDIGAYGTSFTAPGSEQRSPMHQLGAYLRDVFRLNESTSNFRMFAPDETASNRLDGVFEVTKRCWLGSHEETDDNLSPDGRVLEVLSEHLCEGWLEGYLLTGRHGVFSCYEAFMHIVDSMFNQYAKWLESAHDIAWRKPVSALNYVLTSHVWQQDHNGFSHQDPGFISHVMNKSSRIVRVYLPPDANTLLSVFEHCLKSTDMINVVIAGKQPESVWLTPEQAKDHCRLGADAWRWAGNVDDVEEADVVLACAGDTPTREILASAMLLRDAAPDLRIQVTNVVDLMSLLEPNEHAHGMPDERFSKLFGEDTPVVFAFHGYPPLIHQLIHKRANQHDFHVHGYQEHGTTTTPFDMCVLNEIDRYSLAAAALRHARADKPEWRAAAERIAALKDRHREYVSTHGDDLPEIKHWQWKSA
ncbi:phosphoketolase family protein [Robbsia sp. KACC 23696]|uniref:phosphoketolase family protein n=1 Tax=Robbsia sp. KACC 23696 TaxID=3149231 RepID=UPI00325ADD3C